MGGGPGDHVSSGLRKRLPGGGGGPRVTWLPRGKMTSGFGKVEAICDPGKRFYYVPSGLSIFP